MYYDNVPCCEPDLDPTTDAVFTNGVAALQNALAADPSALDRFVDGFAPIHLACIARHLECVKVLLEYGANMLVKDSLGMLPIHYPCKNGNLDILEHIVSLYNKEVKQQLLIEMLNTPAQRGQTSLHYAASSMHPCCLEMVKLLLLNGARSLPNDDKLFPSQICDDKESKKLLKKHEPAQRRRENDPLLKNVLKKIRKSWKKLSLGEKMIRRQTR